MPQAHTRTLARSSLYSEPSGVHISDMHIREGLLGISGVGPFLTFKWASSEKLRFWNAQIKQSRLWGSPCVWAIAEFETSVGFPGKTCQYLD